MVLPPADEAGAAETHLTEGSIPKVHELSEEFEVVDDDEFMEKSTSSDAPSFMQQEIMDPALENFIGDILREDD